jgi:hypothetical protein
MDAQTQPQVSVRKNIALKLRDQSGSSPFTKVESPSTSRKEDGEIGKAGKVQELAELLGPHPADSGAEEANRLDYSGLKWDHPVNLCGRPIKDPLLHLCENCSLPVLIYGRMVSGCGQWYGRMVSGCGHLWEGGEWVWSSMGGL